jgi:thioredoxin domain protein
VIDVDVTNFEDAVKRSMQVPVVISLWSPRSQVSAEVNTALESLAARYQGRFQLARVDVDANAKIAELFAAQSVPSVVAVLGGQPVPLFQGQASAQQLEQIFEQVMQMAQANGITGRVRLDAAPVAQSEPVETEVQRLGREAIEAGDYAKAQSIYERALVNEPANDELRLALEQVKLLQRVEGADLDGDLAASDQPEATWRQLLAGADAALAMGDVEGTLARGLEAVRRSSGDERDQARVRLLELFELIGTTDPRVGKTRRALASLLY